MCPGGVLADRLNAGLVTRPRPTHTYPLQDMPLPPPLLTGDVLVVPIAGSSVLTGQGITTLTKLKAQGGEVRDISLGETRDVARDIAPSLEAEM